MERSRGRAVSHLLSSAIMLDCNMKLVRRNMLIPSMALSSALATEAYQLPFNPSGSNVFGMGLSCLLEKADEMAAQRQQMSLKKALVKTARMAKAHSSSSSKPVSSEQGQRPNHPRKRGKKAGQKSGGKGWTEVWQQGGPKYNQHSSWSAGKTGSHP